MIPTTCIPVHVPPEILSQLQQHTVASEKPKETTQRDDLEKYLGQFYRTEMCRFQDEFGKCTRGNKCKYAHHVSELREIPNLVKTSYCKEWLLNSSCNDENCRFAHSIRELHATNTFYRTKPCLFFKRGKCLSGENCRFSHEMQDPQAAYKKVKTQRKEKNTQNGDQTEKKALKQKRLSKDSVSTESTNCDDDMQSLWTTEESQGGQNRDYCVSENSSMTGIPDYDADMSPSSGTSQSRGYKSDVDREEEWNAQAQWPQHAQSSIMGQYSPMITPVMVLTPSGPTPMIPVHIPYGTDVMGAQIMSTVPPQVQTIPVLMQPPMGYEPVLFSGVPMYDDGIRVAHILNEASPEYYTE